MNSIEETTVREGLNVRLDGVQGTVSIAAEERDGEKVVWITTEGVAEEETISIGVDRADLLAAISFVLGEPR